LRGDSAGNDAPIIHSFEVSMIGLPLAAAILLRRLINLLVNSGLTSGLAVIIPRQNRLRRQRSRPHWTESTGALSRMTARLY
jgi:hypothetical protein